MNEEEIILKNWDTFVSQLLKFDSENKMTRLTEKLGAMDMPITPASTKTDLVCCYPGGLVEHSLRVLKYMAKLRKVYDLETTLPRNSVVSVCLLHDIGKVGLESNCYYKPQTDEWKRNKLGQYFEINQRLAHMPVSQLSLMLITSCGIAPTEEEWFAISNVRESTKEQYIKSEPKLSVVLNQAITMACIDGKDKKQVELIT